MKAIILCGLDTKESLHPLTINNPSITLPFCNQPMIESMVAALTKVGVTKLIFAICFDPAGILEACTALEEQYKVEVVCVQEETPLGTGGAIKNLEKLVKEDSENDLFFVCNQDIVCVYPFQEMLERYQELQVDTEEEPEGIICLRKAALPSKYGVVSTRDLDGQVLEFTEKPQNFITNIISAGMYLLNFTVFDRIELEKTSIETQVFPKICDDFRLYSIYLKSFWIALKRPCDYLKAQSYVLGTECATEEQIQLHNSTQILGNVRIVPLYSHLRTQAPP